MTDELDKISIPEIDLGIYEHYSGKQYEVCGVALHSETLEPLVLYRPLYKTHAKLWVRPYDMFVGPVVINGKEVDRFKKVKSNDN